jgi:taurine dioxygenase
LTDPLARVFGRAAADYERGRPDWSAEALDLVTELMTHATQKKYEYRHQWQYGDMVLWDNRSVMHKANPDYDMNERRYLYRLMLKGEPPIPVSLAA